jgi:flagellar biosynthesis protein FlhF
MPGGREALGTLLEAGMDPPLAHEIAACVEARRVGDPLLAELGEAAGARSRSGRKGSGWKGSGAGWNPALSEEAVGGAQEAPEAPRGGVAAKSGAEAGDWRTLLREELERRIDAEATVGRPEARFRAAALVGPPGSGKTTALVKLAVREGLEKRRAVRIVSLDTYRVAATEPLRTYAAILGVNFRTADNPAALGQALVGAGERDLVLIDTPGLAPGESEAAAEVARILLRYPEIEVQLTLGTTTRYADLTSAVDRFEMFRPSKLLFTRLDEATSFGAAFSQAVRTGRPVSFLAVGPRVPEDLEEASRSRLIGLLLG